MLLLSRNTRHAVRAWSFLVLAVLSLAACKQAPADPRAAAVDVPESIRLLETPALDAEPVGQEEYERILAGGAGVVVDARALEAIGEKSFEELRSHMDALAALRSLRAESVASSSAPARSTAAPSTAATSGPAGGSAPPLAASDWRESFLVLKQEHPASVDELLEAYRAELERARVFVVDRDLLTVPDEALEVVEVGNAIIRQSFPLALYLGGKLGVTASATLAPDPEYLANHCSVCIPPLAVHEGFPGHHVGFWHVDHAEPHENPALEELASAHRRNMFVLEGWALYAEWLMLERGFYSDPAQELGAWRSLLHRALRLVIDPQLHTGQLDEDEAVELYVQQVLMTEDAARTEVRRHLSEPTNKATYFVGVLQILALRDELERRAASAGEVFDLHDFHDRLLRWSTPIPVTAREEFGVELGALTWRSLTPVTPDGERPSA